MPESESAYTIHGLQRIVARKEGARMRMLLHGLWIALIILFAWITVERRWFADPVEPPDHPDDTEWW